MAPLLAGGADPNLPLDEQGNTLLHKAQSPEEIAALLNSPLIDVNVTNKVRATDDVMHPSLALPAPSNYTAAALTSFAHCLRRPGSRHSWRRW